MKLFYSPGACSIGIHFLLEEIGAPYTRQKVNLRTGEHTEAWFKTINPKSKVPTLERDDGSVLTQFPVIAFWLAQSFPEKSLLSREPEKALRTMEMLDYAVSAIHMQGFTRIFRPEKFSPTETDHEAVKAAGLDVVKNGFDIIDKTLRGKRFPFDTLSIADAALFYVGFWATYRMKLALPESCAAHFEMLRARPSAVRVFEAEGLTV